jgi:aryl-alcohol dehydrogenase-like predicted oxidoreductase
MRKRRFGRTNHNSTLAIFGAVALGKLDQTEADHTIQKVIDAGVNHIDIAPSYGQAEERLSHWMPSIREKFFIGCKTMERSKQGAIKEFHTSLARLQLTHFDLYQMHAVTNMVDLDECTGKGGVLEGIIQMKEEGLTKFIGITGHGLQAPTVFLEALYRFDFDSVLFPLNPNLFSIPEYREKALLLLDECESKDIGVMTIKSVAKMPWGEEEHLYHTWYRPFEDGSIIRKNVDFVLSYPLTHICTVGDYRLLGEVLDACEDFSPMSPIDREQLIEQESELESIF